MTPGHAGGAVRLRRHRAPVVHGRQRQPRGRPGRPAGDAAAARHRLQHDRQRRPRRAPAPRPGRRGRLRPARAADPQARAAQGRVLAGQPHGDHGRPARRRVRRTAARRPTSSRASSTPSTARPAPPSARPTPTSPGTRPTSRTRRARSWSSRPSSSGGFGAETAAPAARLILSEWFHLKDRDVPRGLEPDAMSAQDRPSSRPPSRRPRSCRGSGACAWTRCCCSPRSASSPRR